MSELAISDFSYVADGIPQIIWIALLNKCYGFKQGTNLALNFAKSIDNLKLKKEVPYHLSWFDNLNVDSYETIRKKLIDIKVFEKINIALSPLLNLYPKCPLNKIFSSEKHLKSDVSKIKEILTLLYNKRGKESTFALANVIYLMGRCDKLLFEKNSAMADLPELQDYPDSEMSIMIASVVRASTNFLLSRRAIENSENWISYFWNRGLEIEPNEI